MAAESSDYAMTLPLVALLAAVAFAIGYAFAVLISRSRTAGLAERNSVLEQQLASAKTASDQQSAELRRLSETKAAAEARLEAERKAAQEKLQTLLDAQQQLKSDFKALAASALENNNANFLELAKRVLQNSQTQAAGELAQKEQAVRNLVEPIAQSLVGMNQQIQELEKSRSHAYGTLSAQVQSLLETQKALQVETGNLVKALRDPQARGAWGELHLRKTLELSGMLEHCDFTEQLTLTDEDRRFRPDVIVDLPGGKQVVIDAKVPLTAYLAALEATDDTTRAARMLDHARQTKQHIDTLASRAYWSRLGCTPEFVVMFLPGEVFFRAAMDADPELIEYGVSQKVIVTSPTTLIALLKAVAYGWNQKNLAESAKQISDAGKTLYERLCKMTEHFEKMGKRLGGAVQSYNELLSSMEKRVLPEARKFPEYDRSLASENIPELPQIEQFPRELQAQDWQETIEHPQFDFEEEKADQAKA
jgi:DNA recombination protein RmuC